MSFSVRYVSAVLLTTLGLTATLCAQSTTKQTSKAPGGSVSGRVSIKDKGAAGVAVSLRRSEIARPNESFLRATTDHDGFYRITNVPAGSYQIAPAAPAFIIADSNNPRGKSVVVGEDENVEGINFSLVRGGVITGKVTDADGRPLIQQQVNLFRAEVFDKQTPQETVFPSGNAQTDDRGIYRMYGLTAGRYKVATGRGDGIFVGNYIPMRTSYKQVFHPDVTDHNKATIIEVSEGSEANNVDLKLGEVLQLFSVSGRMIDGESGLPAPNIRFGLQRLAGQRPESVNIPVVSNAQGAFFAEGLIPGEYGVFLFPNLSSEMRADSVNIDIEDQDVTGVTIKLIKGASVSGIVVLESEDKTVFPKLQQMQLRAFVIKHGSSSFGQSSPSPIAADGTFRIAGLPAGAANISLGSPRELSVARGFAISRIERDGVVMRRGVEIKEGEHVAGVRVYVSFGNATIRGVVKLENGTLPPGAQLFVKLSKPGDSLPGLRPPQVDARGHFLMEGIPSGDYELWVTVPGGSGIQARRVKRDVSVQNGVVTDVLITIDLSSRSGP